MDDRELEARLRAHLHRTLDGLDAPRDLRSGVELAIQTPTRPILASRVRLRPSIRVGFSLVAAAAVVVAAALAFDLVRGPSSGPGPSPSQSPVPPSTRTFIVVPPGSAVPSKADSSAAGDVLAARLQALGFDAISSGIGYGMTFELAGNDGIADELIGSVLGATGDVAFVPLPPADFGNAEGSGRLTATVGQPLPEQLPVLLGRDGIASVKFADGSPGSPSPLEITLTPAAAQRFATWTTAHVGELFAIVVDSVVLAAPVVREPVTSGSISLEAATTAPFPGDGVAVLIGGTLPEAWRGATVVKPISQAQAVAAALAAAHGGTISYAGLAIGTLGPQGTWRAYWDVQVDGPACSPPLPCASAMSQLVRVDAATGQVFQIGNLAS
ncbi:MAG TPA: hypothetical protein VFP19_09925 [Candidatus Limnocylindrales bacterium]|nr:hypothetical protein [Candidatus Limnocylindrales bacterium]